VSDSAETPNFKLKTYAVDVIDLVVSGEYAVRRRLGSFGRLVGNYATSLRRIVLCQQELATPPTLSVRPPDGCMSHRSALQ
jgi:hypothetical protein